MTGHTSDVEVARYSRDAEQEHMAHETFRISNLANLAAPALADPVRDVDNT